MSAHPALEDFHFGAPVFAADGVHVGELHRLIVDEESLDPHSIVVKETRQFSGHHFAGTALIEDDVTALAELRGDDLQRSAPASNPRS